MSRRLAQFAHIRQDKTGMTWRSTWSHYEANRPKNAPGREHPRMKFEYDRTLAAITRGQRTPMRQEKAERIARNLCGG